MRTVSLALSKSLKEAGYPQDAEFWWSKEMDFKTWKVENCQFFKIDKRRDIASPTVDEVLDLLPAIKDVDGEEEWLRVEPIKVTVDDSIIWSIGYPHDAIEHLYMDESLADAAAKCWLYLKKEGLI